MNKQLEQQKLDSQLERVNGPLGNLTTFNLAHGYDEAILKGMRSGFLTEYDYQQLCHCVTLEEAKLNLNDTDYKIVMQAISGNASVDELMDKSRSKTVAEYEFLRTSALGPLATFLDFMTYEFLIQSVQLIISSLIKEAKPETLLAKCHPLGQSPFLKSVLTFENFENSDGLLYLYSTVLIDTPVAKYFAKYFASEVGGGGGAMEIRKHYDSGEINVITTMLNKYWLEDFYQYCMNLGGETAAVMGEVLGFEADRRALEIMYNSFGKQLSQDVNREGRQEMFCNFGSLYPEATMGTFRKVGDEKDFAEALRPYKQYGDLLRRAEDDKDLTFNKLLLEYQTKLMVKAFDGQSHFGCFYAFLKLKDQEERNLKWILSCIAQNRSAKDKNKLWLKTF